MGGPGSGTWSRWDRQTTIEETKRLDIRHLQDSIRLGYAGRYTWSAGGSPAGSIDYRVEHDRLVLDYRVRVHGGEWESIEEPVQLSRTPCNYGGERLWFLCPACSKRVAVLASHGKRFVCRHCHKLPYGSQQDGYMERMQRKARKVRKKLGATNNLTESIWRKPKGMHQKTFDRLRQEEQAANHAAIMAMGRQLGILERFLL